ncbi:hypothetical protein TYRP_022340, partial [Tyrophagus putrescentiae]
LSWPALQTQITSNYIVLQHQCNETLTHPPFFGKSVDGPASLAVTLSLYLVDSDMQRPGFSSKSGARQSVEVYTKDSQLPYVNAQRGAVSPRVPVDCAEGRPQRLADESAAGFAAELAEARRGRNAPPSPAPLRIRVPAVLRSPRGRQTMAAFSSTSSSPRVGEQCGLDRVWRRTIMFYGGCGLTSPSSMRGASGQHTSGSGEDRVGPMLSTKKKMGTIH